MHPGRAGLPGDEPPYPAVRALPFREPRWPRLFRFRPSGHYLPPLPAPVDRGYGAIVGQGESGRHVEACAEMPSFHFEETPCSNQSFVRSAIADREGHFAIAGLPGGRYYVIWQVDEDTWSMLTKTGSVLGERVLVEAGQETHVTLR